MKLSGMGILTIVVLGTACGKAPTQTSELKFSSLLTGIIGGNEVQVRDPIAKSVVAIYDVESKGLCTGSILSSEFIVTAAHCVTGTAQNLRVVFGLDIASEEGRRVMGADQATPNPKWAASRQARINRDMGDIAIIKLRGALPAGFVPAQLLQNKSDLQDGGNVTLAGYGITDGVSKDGTPVLRKVNVTIKMAEFSPSEVLMDQTQGRGACHGDSGGPAYALTSAGLRLFGVTSRGVNDLGDTCSSYSAYTNILAHADWIRATSRMMAPMDPPLQISMLPAVAE